MEQLPPENRSDALNEVEGEAENCIAPLEETEAEIQEESLNEVESESKEEIRDEPLEETEEPKASQDETAALRARIDELEQELAERVQMSNRMERECTEFETYFPDVSLKGVPDEVWGQVHAGVPLSAAYALYEKKQQKQKADAQRISQRGESLTAGIVDTAGNEYFSPAQVRAMSPSEVRQNYDRIFESMRHWQ